MTNHMKIKTFQFMLFILLSGSAFGQQSLTQQQAVQAALDNNLMVKAGEYQVAGQKELKQTAFDLGKTNVTWMHGQFNSVLDDNNYTITQSIPFPTVMSSQAKLANAQIATAETQLTLTKNELVKSVRSVYSHLAYLLALHNELIQQDSVFSRFAMASEVNHRLGEGTLLEMTSAKTQWMEIRNQLMQNESDISIYKRELRTLLNVQQEINPTDAHQKIEPLEHTPSIDDNPQLQLLNQEINVAYRAKRLEQNKLLPDIMLGYFTQSLIGFQRIDNQEVFFDKNDRFTGFQVGVSFPLWFVPQRSRSKAAALTEESSTKKYEFYHHQLEGDLQRAQLQLAKSANSLEFYERNANENANLLLRQSQKSFEEGEIGYLEFLLATSQARAIKFKYLEMINQYNQAAIQLDYLTGKF